jgi:hypothetical protein
MLVFFGRKELCFKTALMRTLSLLFCRDLEQKFNKIASKAISRVEIITAFITSYASSA